jgi:hypothetical protein
MTDKRARMLCAWCLAEGKSIEEAHMHWTETPSGEPSHGICKAHADIEYAKLDAREKKEAACTS